MDDDFSPAAIARSLSGSFGAQLRFFDAIGSTNAEALDWAEEGAPHGAVVVADHQTAGRGRWGREWVSRPGGALLFSVILRPELDLEAVGILSTAAGVGVAEGIEDAVGVSTSLKWPNDVMIDGKKVGGILIESRPSRDRMEAVVVGVGINVRVDPADLPPEAAARATDLSTRASTAVERAHLLGRVLAAMERRCADLIGDRDDLIAAATDRSEIIGHEVTVRFADGSTIEGRAAALARDGGLELQTREGVQVLHVAEVERLRPA